MAPWKNWLLGLPSGLLSRARRTEVETVRRQLLALLDDCHGFQSDRLRWRLRAAGSAQDLWLLRSAIFQVVADQHCQSLAAARVNALVPAFRRVLPARQVTPV